MESLNVLLNRYSNQPKQKSPEWLKYRSTRIGGSEMHNVCKLSKTNAKSFIKSKLNTDVEKKKFIPNCEFGNLFEQEICSYSGSKFNTKIHNIEVVPYPYLNMVCYSPDGLAVINDELVLFEFKCPITRIPSNNIKYEYDCQINTGLTVLRNCNKCYYCEGEFKKCKLSDLHNYTEFNTEYHRYNNDRDFTSLYNTYGLIYIYSDKKHDKISDIGTYNTYAFNSYVLEKIFSNEYKVLHLKEVLNYVNIDTEDECMLPYNTNNILPTSDFIVKLQSYFTNYITNILNCYVVGYIPWKLYNFNTIIVPKPEKPFFTDYMKKKLLYIGDIIKYGRNPDKEDSYLENKIQELLNIL